MMNCEKCLRNTPAGGRRDIDRDRAGALDISLLAVQLVAGVFFLPRFLPFDVEIVRGAQGKQMAIN